MQIHTNHTHTTQNIHTIYTHHTIYTTGHKPFTWHKLHTYNKLHITLTNYTYTNHTHIYTHTTLTHHKQTKHDNTDVEYRKNIQHGNLSFFFFLWESLISMETWRKGTFYKGSECMNCSVSRDPWAPWTRVFEWDVVRGCWDQRDRTSMSYSAGAKRERDIDLREMSSGVSCQQCHLSGTRLTSVWTWMQVCKVWSTRLTS